MAERDLNIQMRLASVSEVSYMMSPGIVGDRINPELMKIGFSSQIHPDVQNDTFVLIFGVRYELEGEIVLESVYRFFFEVKDLAQFIVFNDVQSITVNHIMPHFLSVAVGTMRGILVAKTAGTPLGDFPLPIIDVNQLNNNLSTHK